MTTTKHCDSTDCMGWCLLGGGSCDQIRREHAARTAILEEVAVERARQDDKWGEQNHPNGTGSDRTVLHSLGAFQQDVNLDLAELAKQRVDLLARSGACTYEAILTEEWAEAIACDNPAELRAELIQVAAVAVAWVEAIDRRACTECREATAVGHGMCGSCLHDALRSGWVPGS